ncbi:xanthine dehydrogenase family protein molybdopterin-binding subunit [Desulfurococcus amylolyticus]|uniref:xanthine dehydrogenase family protein molybdopterin-binding subunit n=1 Tax=Desulfurococcus amylolyticus TaxID=94694 RepID=UPI0023F14E62|nr:xanthine dehydrogenase family protein molybdopterin-binding subunit [Desulfurococcus amylolyticus]
MSKPEYVEIVEKIFNETRSKPTKDFKYIGKHVVRWDAISKATGKPIFTADLINLLKNPVFVYSVRSKYAHALIKGIDVSEAVNYPGVIKVITSRDIPGINDVGYVLPDQPLIADRKVRYIGDTVALIVAESLENARDAGERVHVDYEPLEVYLDPLQIIEWNGLKEKPHTLIHDERGSDVLTRYKIRVGDVEKAFKEASVIVENEYRTPMQEHAYLEPEVAIAIPEPDGGVTIYAKTQCPFDTRRAVSNVLGLPFNMVRVIAPALGGGFGGAEDVGNEIAAKAALAALYTKKPAVVLHTREESIIGHTKRHPIIARYKHAARRDGTLLGVEAEIILDKGAYASLGPFVAWRAIVHSTGPYRVPNAKIDLAAVYTNKVPGGAFRGFGNPQVTFAVERQMDILAEELGLDPVEIRLRNALRPGDRTVHGQLLDHGVGLVDAIKKAVELSGWYEKRKLYSEAKGTIRRGIGIAVFYHGNSIGAEGADYSSVTLIIQRDGSIIFRTGLTDMGQGSIQGLINIAAEILGVPPSYFKVELPDTASTPDAGPTVASRSTAMGGNATLVAAYKLRKRLNELASSMLGCSSPDDVVIDAPKVYCRDDPEHYITWRELVEQSFWKGVPLQEFGYYRAPPAEWHEETGTGQPYFTYTFGAIVSDVEVDLETGVVRVKDAVTVYDIGRVINRTGAEHHGVGGYIQGMGYALMEDTYYSPEGHVYNTNLSTYHIPTGLDIPERILVDFVEAGYIRGPFGAKGLGEPSIVGIAPSIANAVAHALGSKDANRDVNRIPLTPDTVFSIIKKHGLNKR